MADGRSVVKAYTAPAVSTPLAERYRAELSQLAYESHEHEDGRMVCRKADGYTRLIPNGDLLGVCEELRRALVPAKREQAMAAVAMLIGAYRKADLEDPEMFMQLLLHDLAEYPADVLAQTSEEIRRTCKFFPTIAECREVATRIIRKRQYQLRAAESMIKEAARRDEEQRKDEELRRAELERAEAWHKQLCEAYGADLTPQLYKFRAGEQGVRKALDYRPWKEWKAALDRGAAWALVALWQCHLIETAAAVLQKQPGARARQGYDLAVLVDNDFPAAVEFVALVVAGDVSHKRKPGSSDPEAYSPDKHPAPWNYGWPDVWRQAASMIQGNRTAFPEPELKSETQLLNEYATANGLSQEAREGLVASWMFHEAVVSEHLEKLVAAENARMAAIDRRAEARAALVKLRIIAA